MNPATTESVTESTTAYCWERWACMGLRLWSDGKLYQQWERPNGEVFSLALPGVAKNARPGNYYNVWTDGQHVRTKGENPPAWTCGSGAPDQELWEAESTAAQAAHAMKKREAKSNGESTLRAMLAPIRAKYRKTISRAERAAILAAVIDAVTGGAA